MNDTGIDQKKQISVLRRASYGRVYYEPICEEGKKAARLLKKRFFSPSDIDSLKELGYTFEIPTEIL